MLKVTSLRAEVGVMLTQYFGGSVRFLGGAKCCTDWGEWPTAQQSAVTHHPCTSRHRSPERGSFRSQVWQAIDLLFGCLWTRVDTRGLFHHYFVNPMVEVVEAQSLRFVTRMGKAVEAQSHPLAGSVATTRHLSKHPRKKCLSEGSLRTRLTSYMRMP